jgi:hypothetical protein
MTISERLAAPSRRRGRGEAGAARTIAARPPRAAGWRKFGMSGAELLARGGPPRTRLAVGNEASTDTLIESTSLGFAGA